MKHAKRTWPCAGCRQDSSHHLVAGSAVCREATAAFSEVDRQEVLQFGQDACFTAPWIRKMNSGQLTKQLRGE